MTNTSFNERVGSTDPIVFGESSLYTLLETGLHMTAGPDYQVMYLRTLVLLLSNQILEFKCDMSY